MDDKMISYGGAIKALDGGKVEGYLVPFTSPDNPDLHGEYFDSQTDFMLEDYPLDNLRVLYHHGLDKTVGVKRVGTITAYKQDDAGLWVQAQLDMRDEYEKYIYELAQSGKLGWSSGALPQSVQTEGAHIRRWAIIEGSLTPTPAMPMRTQITTLKAIAPIESKDGAEVEIEISIPTVEETPITHKDMKTMDNEKLQMLKELVDALLAESSMSMATEDEMKQADALNLDAPIKSAQILANLIKSKRQPAVKSANPEPSARETGAPAYVPNMRVKGKIGRMNPVDTAFMLHMTGEISRQAGKDLLSNQARAEAMKHVGAYVVDKYNSGEMDVDGETYQKAYTAKSMKVNELDHTTNTNYGAEWIPTTWGTNLWEVARSENLVLPNTQTFDMTSKTQYLPVESGDPTVYYVPESTDETNMNPSGSAIPDSLIGTAQKLFTAKKLAIRTAWSSEEDDDSIIAYAQNASRQANVAFREKIDALILNGDTATGASTNINNIDGTPAATDYFLAFNGLLKYPLVTVTANSKDASAYPDFIDGVKATIQTLGREFIGAVDKQVFYCDPETYTKLTALPEFLTMDAVGDRASILTGQVGVLLGRPVVMTPRMALANSAGKIPGAGGTLGRLLLVYKPYWYVGFRRQITSYVARAMDGESYQLTMTARLDMQQHSSADASAVLYNITV